MEIQGVSHAFGFHSLPIEETKNDAIVITVKIGVQTLHIQAYPVRLFSQQASRQLWGLIRMRCITDNWKTMLKGSM
jgi:hypothetical protein